MERVNAILRHPLYREQYRLLEAAEADRVFCRHTMEHFLDVARLMYIRNLEEEAGLSKELIYAAAMLHDLGRYRQMTEGIPHDQAGAELAEEILADCGFAPEAIREIREAILDHRGSGSREAGEAQSLLARYLREEDKKSRCCFRCPAERECSWSEDRKNRRVTT